MAMAQRGQAYKALFLLNRIFSSDMGLNTYRPHMSPVFFRAMAAKYPPMAPPAA